MNASCESPVADISSFVQCCHLFYGVFAHISVLPDVIQLNGIPGYRRTFLIHGPCKSLEEPLLQSNCTAIWSNGIYTLSQNMIFMIALVFWFCAQLVSKREATTFQFFVGLMCSTFSVIQAGNAFSFVPDILSAKGPATDIVKLLDSCPEINTESAVGKKIDRTVAKGHIRLEGIHFWYPTCPGVRVLHDFSIQAEPGTSIALIRASGCDKSTRIGFGAWAALFGIQDELTHCMMSFEESGTMIGKGRPPSNPSDSAPGTPPPSPFTMKEGMGGVRVRVGKGGGVGLSWGAGKEGMLCSAPELKERVLMLINWCTDFYYPFLPAWVARVRGGGGAPPGKDIITFAEAIPNEFCPPSWTPEQHVPNIVYALHWYNLNALFQKAFDDFSVNVQGLSRGMFLDGPQFRALKTVKAWSSTCLTLHHTSDIPRTIGSAEDGVKLTTDGLQISWTDGHESFFLCDFLHWHFSRTRLGTHCHRAGPAA
ncbi:hypothetical protein DFH08DRAFT_1002702 [Mycena albidolilacea]|uniref:Uncharacterized protein n=1 Tax=Mycena albidolilacea TaxID=1033008 RepID=A0AAD7AQE0_9AGAR|nr:hypothetical protein DFH08DRAFT_1002702 [Mycena albidolilacea]